MKNSSKLPIPDDYRQANYLFDDCRRRVENLLQVFKSAAQWKQVEQEEKDPVWWPELINIIQEAAAPLVGLARTWQAETVAAVSAAEDQKKIADGHEALVRAASNLLDSLPFFEEAALWETEQNDAGTDWPAGFRILLDMTERIEQASNDVWSLTVEHIKPG